MFKCQKCGKLSKQHESPVRVVVEKREATYPARTYKVNDISIQDPGGVGYEIVREELWHLECSNENKTT